MYKIVPALFLIIVFLSFSAISPPAETYDDLVQEAASAIGRCLKDRGDLKLAVTGIRSSDGGANGLTEFLEDSLTSDLAANPKLTLLERNRLKEVTQEIGLSLGDPMYDQKKALELGKRLSAHIMVSGTLRKIGNAFHLTLRVVDCEEGDILSGCGFREKLPVTPGLMTLWRKRSVRDTPGGPAAKPKSKRVSLFKYENNKPVPAGDPAVFKIGDRFGFCVTPPMDARLYVVTFDPETDGEAFFLYPLPRPPSHPAEGDKPCMFPGFVHPRAVSYPVKGPEGRGVLKVIWVSKHEGGLDLEGMLASAGKPGKKYYSLSRMALKQWLQKMEVLPAQSRGKETVEYWIEAR
jgi:TolB-like protein